MQDAAHSSLLRGSRQQLHAQIAEALEIQSPELMESQPQIFAHHYAEAGHVEKSVACWGKAGHGSGARSAMVEAAAQFQKGLDQLALLPDSPNASGASSSFGVPWPRCSILSRLHRAGNRARLCARTRAVGAAGFPVGVPSRSLWAISLSLDPRGIRCSAAVG